MKQKTIFSMVLMFILSTVTMAQNNVDSSGYYLDLSKCKYKESLDLCVNQLNKWKVENQYENAMVLVYFSAINKSEFSIAITLSFNSLTVSDDIPDFYSIINGITTFWYTGKSTLTPQDANYRDYFINRFPKYFNLNAKKSELSEYLEKHKDSYKKGEAIPLSAIFPNGIPTGCTKQKLFYFPSYMIRIKNGDVSLVHMEKDKYD